MAIYPDKLWQTTIGLTSRIANRVRIINNFATNPHPGQKFSTDCILQNHLPKAFMHSHMFLLLCDLGRYFEVKY